MRGTSRRIAMIVVMAVAWSAAVMAAPPQANDMARVRKATPRGLEPLQVFRVSLGTRPDGRDLAGVLMDKQGRFQVVLLHHRDDYRRAIPALRRDGSRTFIAPIQDPNGKPEGKLIFTHPLEPGRPPYLFVTCYLADVYELNVFKPGADAYREVFSVHSQERPRWNARTGVLHVLGQDPERDKTFPTEYRWRGGTFKRTR